jgi:hypothetical protein
MSQARRWRCRLCVSRGGCHRPIQAIVRPCVGTSPPPCLRRARGSERNMPLGPPMALCSPVGGKGRLVPMTWVSLSTAETVEAPAQMPAHIWASMPSCGGREGIDGTGMSSRPEAHRTGASFLYYSFVDKVITQLNHQPRCAG